MALPIRPDQKTTLGNRIAHAVANFALRTFATEKYRDSIEGGIAYGMDAAVRDHILGLGEPPHWSEMIDEEKAYEGLHKMDPLKKMQLISALNRKD